MTRRTPNSLAAACAAAVIVAAMLAGCRRGAGAIEDQAPPVEPYRGFFQAQLGDDIYLFANLDEKRAFDREPASLTYTEFISRVGQRILVSNADPALVPRIQVAYEMALDTELMPVDAIRAPEPNYPPPAATRRTTSRPDSDAATLPATTRAPASRPSTLPRDRLGPTGDPPPRGD